MTLYIYNPHIIPIDKNILSFLFRKRAPQNMLYLLRLIKSKDYDVKILVDDLATMVPIRNFPSIPTFIRKLIAKFDIYIWSWLNGVPFKKINRDISKLNQHTDSIYGWGTVNSIFESNELTKMSFIKDYPGRKVFQMNHYFVQTSVIAKNLEYSGIIEIIAEADLKKNNYFKQHFNFITKVHNLPFALRERYESRKHFKERMNKCLATGTYLELTLSDPNYADFHKFYKVTDLHPMRKAIYENKNNLAEYIDSIISKYPFEEEESKNKKITKGSKIFEYIIKIFADEQKKYLNLDIVEQYNNYKMVIAPEERVGLPSVSFCEILGCGSAYIGLDSDIYYDLGMKKDYHFISYDGSLENLIEKIKYYQNHNDELETIAQNGYEFAQENLREDVILDKFYHLFEVKK